MDPNEIINHLAGSINAMDRERVHSAGRVFYCEGKIVVLAMHSLLPENTEMIAVYIWDNLPAGDKEMLRQAGFGFAVRQI